MQTKSLKNSCVHFVLAIALLLLPAFAFAQPGFLKAKNAQDKHTPALFKINGVVATGVSLDDNGNSIIRIFTARPNVLNLPVVLDGVNVQHVVSGEFFAGDKRPKQKPDGGVGQNPPGGGGGGNGNGGGGNGGGNGGGGTSPTDDFPNPVPIGVSIGTWVTGTNYCFAGTLGCRLKTNTDSHFVLSNNHVMADENNGSLNSDIIIQPGTLDKGNGCQAPDLPDDEIGVLTAFIPINFSDGSNLVDAAIASTTVGQTGVATPSGEGYGAPTSNPVSATLGMKVVKYGRTTELTYGKVDSVNVSVNVGYSTGTATFVNQIVIKGTRPNGNGSATFSSGGDSGSLIVQKDANHPVGLLFAGNNSFTIANPIQAVLDAFSGGGTTFFIDDGN